MANETKPHETEDSDQTNTETTLVGKSWFARLQTQTMQHWLAILLISTLVIHGIGLVYYKHSSTRAPVEFSPEIALGNYGFTADKTSGARIVGAEFSLYITALEGLDKFARSQLNSHKFRIQQEIEVLLRQAHSGDFDDPALNDLKRQIREQINTTLGSRVVSDVIITNLKTVTSGKQTAAENPTAAQSPPWLDKNSSYVNQKGEN